MPDCVMGALKWAIGHLSSGKLNDHPPTLCMQMEPTLVNKDMAYCNPLSLFPFWDYIAWSADYEGQA